MNTQLFRVLCVLCGSLCVAAEPNVNWTGFEDFAMGATDLANAGVDGHFSFASANEIADGSVVRGFDEPLAFLAACGVPDYFKDQTNARYLDVATWGGTLWRSLHRAQSATDVGESYTLVTPVFCDTLVQFTPSAAPTVDATKDQFALWMDAENRLCLNAGRLRPDGTVWPTTFVFTNAADLVTRAWYRLTIEALPNISGVDGGNLSAFRFYLDGSLLKAAQPGVTKSLLAYLRTNESAFLADADAGAIFGSLRGCSTDARATFTALGFSGSGALDDLAFTEETPLFLANLTSVDFTLALGEGVSSVAYVLGDASPVTVTARSTNIAVAAGSVVTLRDAVAADWYQIDAATLGDFTVTAAQTNTVTASLIASPITGVGTAAVRDWATARGLSSADVAASAYRDASYLFNTEALLTQQPTLAITAIREVAAGWELTVAASTGDATLSLANLNGVLKLKAATTLEGLKLATAKSIAFTTDAQGRAVLTVTGEARQFMQAAVGLATEDGK